MVKQLSLLIASILMLTSAFLVHAEETEFPKQIFKVCLSIKGDAKSEYYSYTARELRSLGDIEIIDNNNALFTISLRTLKLTNNGGKETGYAVSILVTESTSLEFLKESATISKTDLDLIKAYAANSCRILHQGTVACGIDEIDVLCKKLVTEFDSSLFQERRDIYNKWKAANKWRAAYDKRKEIRVNADSNETMIDIANGYLP